MDHGPQRELEDKRDFDPRKRPPIRIFGREIPVPQSPILRIILGVLLILLGTLGFLPILGVWMIPLGLVILSYDIAAARRLRRRFEVWWAGRRRK